MSSAAIQHNSSHSSLSPVQEQVIAALAQGNSVSAAAKTVSIHRTTIHHWIRSNTEFSAALQQTRADYIEQLRDDLRELSSVALSTLKQLLEDPKTPPSVRLRASLAVLERPTFPKPGWTFPEPVETPDRQETIDNCSQIEAEYRRLLHEDKLFSKGRRPSVPELDEILPAGEIDTPRNSPCPCGSGRKYKRCCGVAAPPVLG